MAVDPRIGTELAGFRIEAVIGRGADVYSLGCVLYQCLTAELPVPKDSQASMLYAHLIEPPPRLSAKRPDPAVGLDSVIATALAKSRTSATRPAQS